MTTQDKEAVEAAEKVEVSEMSEQRFPPRVGVERQHICALTGLSRWKAVHGPRAHYIIDPVVNDEYLSLAEHQHLMAEKDKRMERLMEALEGLLYYWTNTPCRFDHNGNCQAHSCFGYDKTCSVADARVALQEDK